MASCRASPFGSICVYACGSEDATASDNAARDKAPRALGRYWLATGVFVLALLAKPSAVVVPVVAWVLDVWGWPPTWGQRRPVWLLEVLRGVLREETPDTIRF